MFIGFNSKEIDGNFNGNSFTEMMRKEVVGGEFGKRGHFKRIGKPH